jgi:competence protein ComEC
MKIKNKNLIYLGLGIVFCLNVLAWHEVFTLSGPKKLSVNFLDVGQGDSIFIETPNFQQILIDGGPSSKVLEELAKKMPFYDRSIDMVILTHPDPDHLNGIVEVLKSYKVDLVAFNGANGTDPAFAEFKKLIVKKAIPLVVLTKGKIAKMGVNLELDVLWPEQSLEGQKVSDFNISSIVSQLIYENTKYLFTADISTSVENKLIKAGTDLDSDVLKIGHHGSKYSSSDNFLQSISPQIAVISCGKDNRYGHPAPETLERLENQNIKYLRTDQLGDIKIESDGNNLKIN